MAARRHLDRQPRHAAGRCRRVPAPRLGGAALARRVRDGPHERARHGSIDRGRHEGQRAGVRIRVVGRNVRPRAEGSRGRRVLAATGIPDASYSRQKATVETMLDVVENARPDIRIVRMRPSLILKRSQAAEATRFFLGRLVPRTLLRPERLRIIPDVAGLRFQVTHTDDVARAFHHAIVEPVRGAFNIAADPILDLKTVATTLDARTVRVPASAARAAVELSWRLHLQPTDRGWLEMGLETPTMSTQRARERLGWVPQTSSVEAVTDLLEGIAAGSGEPTPRLEPIQPSA